MDHTCRCVCAAIYRQRNHEGSKLCSVAQSITEETLYRNSFIQGRKLEAGPDAEIIKGATYQLPLLDLTNQLSSDTQDHQPRDGTVHSDLGPLT